MGTIQALRSWSVRRWRVAAGAAVVSGLALGIPTDVIPNPWFGRQGTPVLWWSYPALFLTAVLSGLLFATYVNDRPPTAIGEPAGDPTAGDPNLVDRPGRLGSLAGMMSFFAIGCPVCNKIAVVALGAAGATKWFAPVQPVLAVISFALIAWALRARLRGEIACPSPLPVA